MEWSDRMNLALSYIEDNLTGDIDTYEAARLACCSRFHFQRMFFAIIGVTPAEYARRRRLTMAAREIATADCRVIDTAVKYGYDSPDSFTRAFRNFHGVTPQAARASGVKLAAFPRVSFHFELKGGNDVDYRIIKKPAFPIAITRRRFTTADNQNFVLIPKWWEEFLKSQDCATITALAENKPGKVTGGVMLGVCIGDGPVEDPQNYEVSYGIAVELPDNATAAPFEKMEIPAATWAVFDCTLPMLQDVTKRIYSEWFPSTGYEHDDKPEIEVYLAHGQPGEIMRCQIWIPVVEKKG